MVNQYYKTLFHLRHLYWLSERDGVKAALNYDIDSTCDDISTGLVRLIKSLQNLKISKPKWEAISLK